MRVRVIYGDLSVWVGTADQWAAVRDGILYVQIERLPGHWVSLFGHDQYYIDGDRAGGYTDRVEWDLVGNVLTRSDLRLEPVLARAGQLVDDDVWQQAKALAREIPVEAIR